jgi:hypothetical protein
MWSWRDKSDDYNVKRVTVEYREDRPRYGTPYPHITQMLAGGKILKPGFRSRRVVTHLS